MEVVFVYTESMTNPVRAAEVFGEMRDMGADAVCFPTYEQDMLRWPKDVPRIHQAADDAGLRRYVSPARLGGLTSGLMMVPSLYTFLHPETLMRIPDDTPSADPGIALAGAAPSYFAKVGCVRHPRFREHVLGQIEMLFDRLRPDGILLDEPKGLRLVCECEHCRAAQRPGETLEAAQMRYQIAFLGEMCDRAKAGRPDARTMMLAGLGDEDLAPFAAIRSLDVLGIEPYWAALGKDLDWLRRTCDAAVERIRAHGKRSQVWAFNFGLAASHQAELPAAYRIIAESRPDQLWSFWWWRANDDPVEVMRLTREGLRSIR